MQGHGSDGRDHRRLSRSRVAASGGTATHPGRRVPARELDDWSDDHPLDGRPARGQPAGPVPTRRRVRPAERPSARGRSPRPGPVRRRTRRAHPVPRAPAPASTGPDRPPDPDGDRAARHGGARRHRPGLGALPRRHGRDHDHGHHRPRLGRRRAEHPAGRGGQPDRRAGQRAARRRPLPAAQRPGHRRDQLRHDHAVARAGRRWRRGGLLHPARQLRLHPGARPRQDQCRLSGREGRDRRAAGGRRRERPRADRDASRRRPVGGRWSRPWRG